MSKQSHQRPLLYRLFTALLKGRPSNTSVQVSQPTTQLRPPLHDHDAWHAYWNAHNQPWRTEAEIGKERQEYLTQRGIISPDIVQGVYPFKDIPLSRADVEWLLATHENSRGPIDWIDEHERERKGLDLRGANLCQVDLSHLPLARLRGGLAWDERSDRTPEGQSNMAAVHLEGANLYGAHLEGARLHSAHLEGVKLGFAHLERADLVKIHLEGGDLVGAFLMDADLGYSHLIGANLSGVRLGGGYMRNATLGDAMRRGPRLVDIRWGDINLAVVKWTQVEMLGDEYEARQTKQYYVIEGKGQIRKRVDKYEAHQAKQYVEEVKDRATRLNEYETAVRANRQLAVVFQTQGLNENAARFSYRAQVLQGSVLWFQVLQRGVKFRQRLYSLGAWLFSWFLHLLAGYGYRPGRSFFAYLFVIIGFATSYYLLGLHDVVGPHHVLGPHYLTWYEAIVVSMTAFHGRGFFAGTFQPGDPQAFVAAFEAFVGLIIEVTFIATLTRRLFGQ